jgi:high-affinity nickel permease
MESSALLFANTLLLGLRHGLDWDHLAAISDIVGSSNRASAMKLSTSYAVGHAAVVTLLGVAVIVLGNFMPDWVGGIAEKAVGVTLVGLGVWLLWNGRDSLRDARSSDVQTNRFAVATTFGVGMVHGIGAETGTQMLLLASVGGAHNSGLAVCLLLAFVTGLLISNSAIAVAGIAGFTAARYKRLSNILGIIAAIFSVGLGLSLLR